jgi:phosphatidate cytidylyltransferase
VSEEIASLSPRSDLGIRTLSGIVMMGIAIAAIWFGGMAFLALVLLVGLGVFWEFCRLVFKFVSSPDARLFWVFGGLVYVGIACLTLIVLSAPFFGMTSAILLIAGVIGTDIGAYFAGRTFGGPKIAPQISPSKTWSGLAGGMLGAGSMMITAQSLIQWVKAMPNDTIIYDSGFSWAALAITGVVLAIVAQTGDFFESWMKRRAGVKDSGRLLPGHGGLFDRTDGLIAVAFATGVIMLIQLLVSA